MDEQQRLDATAPGTVAIAGIMAVCNILAAKGAIDRAEVVAIRDFMLASTEGSKSSPLLQSHLQAAIEHHFAALLEALDAQLRMDR